MRNIEPWVLNSFCQVKFDKIIYVLIKTPFDSYLTLNLTVLIDCKMWMHYLIRLIVAAEC